MRLHSTTGGYDKTIPISKYYENRASDGTVDVHFDNVPTTDRYNFTYIGADGTETMIDQNTAFQDLQDTSQATQDNGAPAPTPGPQP
ncbi:MAG TPA: hypothetical protein VK335_23350 [Bryobacteraceae bacterium]|nr:hypothetical protein [Bryobacteraceae bacterium]